MFTDSEQTLPGVLARSFAVASPTLTTQPQIQSSSKIESKIDANVNADAAINIQALIATRIRQISQTELGEMHYEASRDAVHDLEEAADDLKADLNETRNEGITELQNASETSLTTFQDLAAEVVKQMTETLEEHADEAYTEVWDDISDLVAIKQTMSEKMERRILTRAKHVFQKEKTRRKLLSDVCKPNQDGA